VALARLALETRPSLWVLDEPFEALDADGIAAVQALIQGHLARRGGVLLTSHLALDAQQIPFHELNLDGSAGP
jgi:heme exporter protein A